MAGNVSATHDDGDNRRSSYMWILLVRTQWEMEKEVFVYIIPCTKCIGEWALEKRGWQLSDLDQQVCVTLVSHESKLNSGHLFTAAANLFLSPDGYTVWNMF